MNMISDAFHSANEKIKGVEDYLIESVGEKVGGPLMKFAEFSDEHFWKHLLTNEKRANAAFYIAAGSNAISVVGIMGYGLLTNNTDVVWHGFEGHILADALLLTLAPRYAEYRKAKKDDIL